jgi:hypothetical protein
MRKPGLVRHHHFAVRSDHHIHFKGVYPEFQSMQKTFDRVFRHESAGAAVSLNVHIVNVFAATSENK